MKTQQDLVKSALFDQSGIRAANFKLFPGKNRDATAEQISAEIMSSLERIAKGHAEEISADAV